MHVADEFYEYFLFNYSLVNVKERNWWQNNFRSDNSSVQSANKPLPEPVLI